MPNNGEEFMANAPAARVWVAAFAGISTLLIVAGPASAQQMPVFEQAPSVETLRNILIPESSGGTARKIIVPRREDVDAAKPIQPAAASTSAPAPAPRPAAEQQPQPAAAPATIDRPSEGKSTPPPAATPPQAQRDEAAGALAFRIQFALNSAAIPGSADPFLDRLAAVLKEEDRVSLLIEGHTDASGSDDYNRDLSERRAQAVGDALVRRGVDAKRLAILGKGRSAPLVEDPFDPKNRRVEFIRSN
jgi:outer membrane protein OmpA-like peptidoglycan-associated protein